MAMRLSGIWFKYVEPDGFYLGILMVPKDAADMIEKHGRCRTPKRWGLPSIMDFVPAAAPVPSRTIDYIDIVAMNGLMEDAVAVFGISPSDLNREKGFAFIPSADYMKRGWVAPSVEVNTGNRYKLPEVEFEP